MSLKLIRCSGLLPICLCMMSMCLLAAPVMAKTSDAQKSNATILKTSKNRHQKPTWMKKLTLGVSLSTSMGSGSFASSSYKNHYVGQSLGLSVAYRLPKRISLSGGWGFGLEYTLPDNRSGRRFFPKDISLGASWSHPILALKKFVNTGLSLGLTLPTSYASQVSTRYTSLSARLSLSRRFGPVTIGYGGGFSRSLHKYTSSVLNQGNMELPSILMRQETRTLSSLSPSEVSIPGFRNVAWQVNNSLSLSVRILESLSAGISFAIYNSFKYAMPSDQYTPSIQTAEGDVKADTTGRSDFTWSQVYVSWSPLKYLGLSAGVVSAQPPFQANNQGLRFPFFNFATANNNFTTIYFRINGRY